MRCRAEPSVVRWQSCSPAMLQARATSPPIGKVIAPQVTRGSALQRATGTKWRVEHGGHRATAESGRKDKRLRAAKKIRRLVVAMCSSRPKRGRRSCELGPLKRVADHKAVKAPVVKAFKPVLGGHGDVMMEPRTGCCRSCLVPPELSRLLRGPEPGSAAGQLKH